MTTESEHPVRNLLSRMLAALNAAEHLTTDAERRRFLNEWLNTACRDSGLHDEITSLRQLLRKNHTMPIGNLLNALLVNAGCAGNCDIFRFRAALSNLMKQGWRPGICRFPDDILHEALLRSRSSGRRNHILQLSATENCFSSTGNMVAPVAFHLIQQQQRDCFAAEQAFYAENFQVMSGKENLLEKGISVRTIYIGQDTLPSSKWGARRNDLWHPTMSSVSAGNKYVQ
ncbi:TPA: hypothetical protein ACP7Q6_005011 [Escherichia coli]